VNHSALAWCLEQNLGPTGRELTKKIDAFMRLIHAI
jgi:hypothetical protein